MQGVFQLADITRPRIVQHHCQRFLGNFLLGAPEPTGIELDKVIGQHRDILFSLTQRRQVNGGDVQAIKEILTKAPFLNGALKIDVRRRNHPDVDTNGLMRSDAGNFPFLKDAQ